MLGKPHPALGIDKMSETDRGSGVSQTCRFPDPVRHDGCDRTVVLPSHGRCRISFPARRRCATWRRTLPFPISNWTSKPGTSWRLRRSGPAAPDRNSALTRSSPQGRLPQASDTPTLARVTPRRRCLQSRQPHLAAVLGRRRGPTSWTNWPISLTPANDLAEDLMPVRRVRGAVKR
jgi:hypothetical protein